MKQYASRAFVAGCASLALLAGCAPLEGEEGYEDELFAEDGDKKKTNTTTGSTGASALSVVGLSPGSGLVQGLLMQPYESAGGTLREVGAPLPVTNLSQATLQRALSSKGLAASSFRAFELTGYLAIRTAGTFKLTLENANKNASTVLKVDLNADGNPDSINVKNGITLGVGAHAFSLMLTTTGEVPTFKKAEGQMTAPSKVTLKPLPDALFAREPDTTGGGTTGGTTGGGSTGGTTGGGSTGGTTPNNEPWCIGEDTDATPPERSPTTHCDICGGREFNSANWAKGKGCIERYQTVSSSATASPACQAFIGEMRDYCCAGFYVHPVRTQCAEQGPYPSVDLCQDGCFPGNPATAGTYLLQAGGPLAPFVASLGDRRGTCYQDDANASGGFTWTCRRAYYLLKNGHVPPQAANEVITWWSGRNSIGAQCGCDAKNPKNPANTN